MSMSTLGFILCLLVVSALFWSGFAVVFVGARYPRHRQTALMAAIGCWVLALVSLISWSYL